MSILKSLILTNADQKLSSNVKVYRMSNAEHECPWGIRVVKLLTEKGIPFEDHQLLSKAEVDALKIKLSVATMPQIFLAMSESADIPILPGV